MQVFIVSQGERSEGSRVKGVFDSIEKARMFAGVIRARLTEDVTWRPVSWKEEAPDYWCEGCDYVDIDTQEVR